MHALEPNTFWFRFISFSYVNFSTRVFLKTCMCVIIDMQYKSVLADKYLICTDYSRYYANPYLYKQQFFYIYLFKYQS